MDDDECISLVSKTGYGRDRNVEKKLPNDKNHLPQTYMLPPVTTFGFHSVSSDQIAVSENGLKAEKKDPSLHYAHGVTYGAKPLQGTSEFEVELLDYGTGWSGTIKLGVAKYKTGQSFLCNQIPRYSPEASSHCVWSSDKIHNRLQTGQTVREKQYGTRNLDSLREGDRIGLRLKYDGSLVFFVNGKDQGLAAENVYEKGHDIYPMVDHYANCKSTMITRSGERMEGGWVGVGVGGGVGKCVSR